MLLRVSEIHNWKLCAKTDKKYWNGCQSSNSSGNIKTYSIGKLDTKKYEFSHGFWRFWWIRVELKSIDIEKWLDLDDECEYSYRNYSVPLL